jgi:hypothetical protein
LSRTSEAERSPQTAARERAGRPRRDRARARVEVTARDLAQSLARSERSLAHAASRCAAAADQRRTRRRLRARRRSLARFSVGLLAGALLALASSRRRFGTPDRSRSRQRVRGAPARASHPGADVPVRGDQLPGEQPHTLPGRVLRRSAARVEASPARHAARHRGPGGSGGTRLPRSRPAFSASALSSPIPSRGVHRAFVPERPRRGLDGTLRRASVPPCARPQVNTRASAASL